MAGSRKSQSDRICPLKSFVASGNVQVIEAASGARHRSSSSLIKLPSERTLNHSKSSKFSQLTGLGQCLSVFGAGAGTRYAGTGARCALPPS